MLNTLYVFGGQEASGAEIVITRLVEFNTKNVQAHLFISPGKFSEELEGKKFFEKISILNELKKLFRKETSKLNFYLKALESTICLSYKVLKYSRKNNIDVVHANTIVPASYLLPAIFISKLFNSKILWMWSDHDMGYFSKLDLKLANLCSNYYDATIPVSNAVKRKYQSNTKAEVIYNGLDTEYFVADGLLRKEFRDRFDIPEKVIVVGIAGTIQPSKGQLSLANVIKRLTSLYPDCYLFIAGSGTDHYKEYLEAIISIAGDNDNINYLGKIENMKAFYNGCDILVSNTSDNGSESLGTTIYEAMAIEKIVLASSTGGSPEILTDQYDGFLFTPDDEEDLFDKLSYVLNNFHSLYDIRKCARAKVEEKFNIVTMANNYNQLLNKLLIK
jgi:glycosyltransferase involved in cell wall biosynthesis